MSIGTDSSSGPTSLKKFGLPTLILSKAGGREEAAYTVRLDGGADAPAFQKMLGPSAPNG